MQWQSQVSPLILTVSRCLIHCAAFRIVAYIYKQLTLPVLLHPSLIPLVFLLGSEMKGCIGSHTLKSYSSSSYGTLLIICTQHFRWFSQQLLFSPSTTQTMLRLVLSIWLSITATLFDKSWGSEWLYQVCFAWQHYNLACFKCTWSSRAAHIHSSPKSDIPLTIMLSCLWTRVPQQGDWDPRSVQGIIL